MSLIDDRVAEIRGHYLRLTAREATAAVSMGALLVDTRPEHQRRRYGTVHQAVVIDRNVLEWRLDPTSAAAIPEACGAPLVIILCQQGYSSTLAVASLRALGVDATDVIGGFDAWVMEGEAFTLL